MASLQTVPFVSPAQQPGAAAYLTTILVQNIHPATFTLPRGYRLMNKDLHDSGVKAVGRTTLCFSPEHMTCIGIESRYQV